MCGAGGKSTLIAALAEELAGAGEQVLVSTTTKMSREQVLGRWRSVRERNPQTIAAVADGGCEPVVAFSDIDETRGKAIGYPAHGIDSIARTGGFTRILIEADGSGGRPLKAPADHEPVFPSSTALVVMMAGASGLNRLLDETTVFRSRLWSDRTGIPVGGNVTPNSLAMMAVHSGGFARTAPDNARRILFINQCEDPERFTYASDAVSHLRKCRGRKPDVVILGSLRPEIRVLQRIRFA